MTAGVVVASLKEREEDLRKLPTARDAGEQMGDPSNKELPAPEATQTASERPHHTLCRLISQGIKASASSKTMPSYGTKA